jgi:glycosyltransferase involved in cell wall biosynthesis
MTTVHFIYPHGLGIATPDAIGRKVAERLSQKYHVVQHDWHETKTIKPGTDDILLGHAHPWPGTIFRRSCRQPGWRRIIAMSPFNTSLWQCAFLDFVLKKCDLFLAITGRYWFESGRRSAFAHWYPKMVHLDLAVDRQDFPVVKSNFNEPGHRRLVYIGHTLWFKNTSYLSEIAKAIPNTQISWIGDNSRRTIPGLTPLGYQDFSTEKARRLVAEHDFMITVGKADANPTTILEAMAWGLIPVCSPQSGYSGYSGIVDIPLGNVGRAVKILRDLQDCPGEELKKIQAANWEALDRHFNWERFSAQVIAAIESPASPSLGNEPLGRLIRFYLAASTSPYVLGYLWQLKKNLFS